MRRSAKIVFENENIVLSLTADATRWLGKAHTQTSDNDRLKRCKTDFKFNPKPSYCVAYVTGCFFCF